VIFWRKERKNTFTLPSTSYHPSVHHLSPQRSFCGNHSVSTSSLSLRRNRESIKRNHQEHKGRISRRKSLRRKEERVRGRCQAIDGDNQTVQTQAERIKRDKVHGCLSSSRLDISHILQSHLCVRFSFLSRVNLFLLKLTQRRPFSPGLSLHHQNIDYPISLSHFYQPPALSISSTDVLSLPSCHFHDYSTTHQRKEDQASCRVS